MKKRIAKVGALVAFLLTLSHAASADDSLFVPREGEVRLGPRFRTANIDGVAIGVRVAALLQVKRDGSTREVRARIVADLADLDAKIGQLAGRLPLPKDNCAQRGTNPVVTVERSGLSVSGNRAIIEIHAELKVWLCADLPFPLPSPGKTVVLTVPFTATLPVRLVVRGPLTISLDFDPPSLDLGEPWGRVVGNVLRLAGVDVSSELDRLLRRALRPEDLQASIPKEFLRLDPQILGARFFTHGGSLAAEIEGKVDLRALIIHELGQDSSAEANASRAVLCPFSR